MSTEPPEAIGYFLQPGYIYCLPSPATVHTVVGSGVSVCVWDRKLKIGAMNHFVYPRVLRPEEATPHFGNVATAELLRMLLESGSRKEDLAAQLVGGASPDPAGLAPLGLENVKAAREVLLKMGVRISSEDVGGFMGRKVVFDIETGHIIILKVYQLRQDDWGSFGVGDGQ